ncbi:MAG TPA: hypothetical protein VGP72_31720 [Planctomycetota bacterium]|jgi:hypothetical protein
MRWRDGPTESGYYWVLPRYRNALPKVVRAEICGEQMTCCYGQRSVNPAAFEYWCGPITPPSFPQEDGGATVS